MKYSLVTGFRCSVIWKAVRKSRSIIVPAESTLDARSVRLSSTRGTYVICTCCHTSIRAWRVRCVTTELYGPTGRRWGNITSRSTARPCLIRSRRLVMTCHIGSHHWGQLYSYSSGVLSVCWCNSYSSFVWAVILEDILPLALAFAFRFMQGVSTTPGLLGFY